MRRRFWIGVVAALAGCAAHQRTKSPDSHASSAVLSRHAGDPMAACVRACVESKCQEKYECKWSCARVARHGRRSSGSADDALRKAALAFAAHDAEQCRPTPAASWSQPGDLEKQFEAYSRSVRRRSAPTDAPRPRAPGLPHLSTCLDLEARSGVTEIAIERTECFGSCPSYTLVLHADGRVDYDGRDYATHVGHRRGKLSTAIFEELARLALDIGYFELDTEYTCSVTDNPTVYTSVVMRGGAATKKAMVRHYAPSESGPARLLAFENAIDDASDFVEWQ